LNLEKLKVLFLALAWS